MSREKKFSALLKASEAAEQIALRHRDDVLEVYELRIKLVSDLESRENVLSCRLDELTKQTRPEAILAGAGSAVVGTKSFEVRLLGERKKVRGELKEKREDLMRAKERVKIAEDELMQSRIERKKIEQLAENYKRAEAINEAARDELNADELTGFLTRK